MLLGKGRAGNNIKGKERKRKKKRDSWGGDHLPCFSYKIPSLTNVPNGRKRKKTFRCGEKKRGRDVQAGWGACFN